MASLFGLDPSDPSILSIIGASLRDAGAAYGGRQSNALENLQAQQRQSRIYQQLQQSVLGTPNAPGLPGVNITPNQITGGGGMNIPAVAAGGLQGGALGSSPQAGQLAQMLSKLPPEVAAPIYMQLIGKQFEAPKTIIGKQGDVGLTQGPDGTFTQAFAIPQEQSRPLTTDEVAQAGLPPGTSAQVGPDGKINILDKGYAPKTQQELSDIGAVARTQSNAALPNQLALAQERGKITAANTLAGIDARTSAANEAAQFNMNDPEDKAYIDAIANYRVRPPSAGRNPVQRKAAVEAALKVNPDFNEGFYDQSAKALRDFGTGSQGNTARSLDVSVAHLETLKELGDALNNGDITLINAAKQNFAQAFGVAAPTNFDTAKAIVADEVAKGVIGGTTAQSDRETLAASLRRSGSPQQIEGAINTFQRLLSGQLGGLRRQYERTTRRKDFDETFLNDATRKALGASEGQTQQSVSASPGAIPVMNTPEEAMKLPPGTTFKTPDGRVKVR